MVRKLSAVPTVPKAEAEPGSSRRVVASTATVDRYGDILEQNWDLEPYSRNPVLLYGHAAHQLPIGTSAVAVEDGQLVAELEFATELSATAAAVEKLWDGRVLRAVSVGFLPTVDPEPIRAEPDQDGYARLTGWRYPESELVELSVVAVPANPDAIALTASIQLTDEERSALFAPEGQQRRASMERRRYRRAALRARGGF